MTTQEKIELAARLMKHARQQVCLRVYGGDWDSYQFYREDENPENHLLSWAKDLHRKYFRESLTA